MTASIRASSASPVRSHRAETYGPEAAIGDRRPEDDGFGFPKSRLFWLTAIPGITGGTGRILYTFIGPVFGERRFTAAGTLVLAVPVPVPVPVPWPGFALQDTGTPCGEPPLIAAVCGIGGANPASSPRPAACWWLHARKGAEAPG
ncbi:hypothetical protein ACFCZ1_11820 [Streptomyces sp. NPDC056224]|uniref:hypothetical protein n=1 Tax=Streptomyces sp. NPDC056224 TaxID=3345750 RepID=UPI0035DAB450